MEKQKVKERGEVLDELLTRLRKEKNWTYADILTHLRDKSLKEKDIKKWEIGLKYPELEMIYQLSEIYEVSSQEFVTAKNNSYERGMASLNVTTIKWICYFLNVSWRVGMVLLVLLYVILLGGSLMFFVTMASMVKK